MEPNFPPSPPSASPSSNTGPSPVRKRVTVGSEEFELEAKYEVVELLGSGAYGSVCAARDTESGEIVAVKKILRPFEHSVFARRTLRELRILRLLRHENILELKDVPLPADPHTYNDIHIVTGFMEADLASIIKSGQALSEEHIQFFIYQILRGIKYCHSAGVVHRDLKPRNLLVNTNCDLRVCDFGLARFKGLDGWEQPTDMTEYVTTRWYRAPEILCTFRNYDEKVDVWSIGCIFAELLLRKPLFPGKSTKHQLELIMDLCGTPTPSQIDAIPNDNCRRFLRACGRKMPTQLSVFLERTLHAQQQPSSPTSQDPSPSAPMCLPAIAPCGLDLLRRMLAFDPADRISVEDALAHPWLQTLHCPDDEPTAPPLNLQEFSFELNPRADVDSVFRPEVYREAMYHHSRKHGSVPPPPVTYPPPPPPPPPAIPPSFPVVYRQVVDQSRLDSHHTHPHPQPPPPSYMCAFAPQPPRQPDAERRASIAASSDAVTELSDLDGPFGPALQRTSVVHIHPSPSPQALYESAPASASASASSASGLSLPLGAGQQHPQPDVVMGGGGDVTTPYAHSVGVDVGKDGGGVDGDQHMVDVEEIAGKRGGPGGKRSGLCDGGATRRYMVCGGGRGRGKGHNHHHHHQQQQQQRQSSMDYPAQ